MGEPKLMRFAQIRPLGSVLGTSFRSPPNPSNENFRGSNEKPGEDGGNNWYLSRLEIFLLLILGGKQSRKKRQSSITFCQRHICYDFKQKLIVIIIVMRLLVGDHCLAFEPQLRGACFLSLHCLPAPFTKMFNIRTIKSDVCNTK